MLFKTKQEALDWYDGQERVLTPEYVKTIPWHDIPKHQLDKQYVPVILYMRDIEKLTEMYYQELLRTPTGRDPVIRRFMDRWSTEEVLHGDLLNRFLNEANYPTSHDWYEETKAKIPWTYRLARRITPWITNLVGEHFTPVHMTWGSINELSAVSCYQRLAAQANHPVLKYLLDAISREEARHSFFYWSIARIKLEEAAFRQQLARFVINAFWAPVGEGVKTSEESNYIIKTLFSHEGGEQLFDRIVSRRISELPGFEAFTRPTDRIIEATKA